MADPALAELASTGGGDYEILRTVPEKEYPASDARRGAVSPIVPARIDRGTKRGGLAATANGCLAHFLEEVAGAASSRTADA